MVSKEFYERLNIQNIYFRSFGGITTILRPETFTPEQATVVCGSELPKKGILTIQADTYNAFSMSNMPRHNLRR